MFFFFQVSSQKTNTFSKVVIKNYIDLLYLLKVDCKRQGGAIEIVLASLFVNFGYVHY